MPTGDHPDEPRDRRGIALAVVLLLVAIALAYHDSVSGTFVFDDFPAIRDNLTIRELASPTVFSPPQNSGVGGRPVANLSFALNHAFGGVDVRGYHVANLLLHAGSALLLFGIVRRTLQAVAGASRVGTRFPTQDEHRPATPLHSRPRHRNPTWLALAVALVWAVHPLTTAAVAYLSQRTELLMAFFYLLTLYAFIRGCVARNRSWSMLSIVACGLGMMSKEVMVTAPVVVLLYDRAFVARSFRAAFAQRRACYIGLAATWLLLGYLLTTGLSQRSVGFGLGVSPLKYALTECQAIVLYLKLALWPSPLVFDYGPIYFESVAGVSTSVVILLILLSWTFQATRVRSAAGFAAGCFFLLLAPTSSVVPVAEQPIAENRMYLPLAAAAALGITAAHAALHARFRAPLLGALAGGLGFLTVARNEDYRSDLSLWQDTVQKRPQNSRAQFNCGVALLDRGRAAEAAIHFERSIQLNPREPKAHNSLGNTLLELGRPAEAVERFATAVKLEPGYARGWFNYGTALVRLGDTGGAIERYERALQLNPRDAAVHDALGNVYFQMNRPADAIPHYQRALRMDPKMADAHYNCGSACLELGRVDEAIAHFSAAAQLKPADAEIRNNWGAALLRAGRASEAIAQFEYALRLRPGYAEARDNLQLARAEAARRP